METLAVLDPALEPLDERTMAQLDGGCPLLDWIKGIIFPIDEPVCDCGGCGAVT